MTMTPIKLTQISGKVFTFNADDYMKIRSEHRIIGNLVGCVVSHTRNGNFNGLPAIYNKYEVRLLVEMGMAIVVNKVNRVRRYPTPDDEQNYKQFREEQISSQAELLKRNKVQQSEQMIDKIMSGKMKKLIKAGHKQEDIKLNPVSVINEIAREYKFDPNNVLVQVPTQMPSSDEDSIVVEEFTTSFKYRVFKDLWKKGLRLTPADSFGGDFLAYPGDPMQYHASHLIHILESTKISAQDLVSKGRLSVGVNKLCVFAYVNGDEIVYQTMKWDGKVDYSAIN